MSNIQTHHAKLWFAGSNGAWKLADFEMREVREALDNLPKFCTDRPEIKELGMISPAMDSLDAAIAGQNAASFKSAYSLLTKTCNRCHEATAHEFNVITEPTSPPFSNQRFEPVK